MIRKEGPDHVFDALEDAQEKKDKNFSCQHQKAEPPTYQVRGVMLGFGNPHTQSGFGLLQPR